MDQGMGCHAKYRVTLRKVSQSPTMVVISALSLNSEPKKMRVSGRRKTRSLSFASVEGVFTVRGSLFAINRQNRDQFCVVG